MLVQGEKEKGAVSCQLAKNVGKNKDCAAKYG